MDIQHIKDIMVETIKEVEDYEELYTVCDVYKKIALKEISLK